MCLNISLDQVLEGHVAILYLAAAPQLSAVEQIMPSQLATEMRLEDACPQENSLLTSF